MWYDSLMNRAIIIHGYHGKPGTNWKPWLRNELVAQGWQVDVPAMPNTDYPVADEWQAKLAETVGEPDANVYLVGHSLGCITILRYLETLGEGRKIGGAVFVAGFTGKFAKYTEGDHDSFFDHELDWATIRRRCGVFVAIHSDDDPNVEYAQLDLFRNCMGAKTVSVHGMGHFGSPDGVFEVPVVRDEMVGLSGCSQSVAPPAL